MVTKKDEMFNWIEAMRIITSHTPDLGMANPEYFRGYQKGCKLILDTLENDLNKELISD
jgi:hypothetical protein